MSLYGYSHLKIRYTDGIPVAKNDFSLLLLVLGPVGYHLFLEGVQVGGVEAREHPGNTATLFKSCSSGERFFFI